jgi:hypothetical protein
MTWKVEIAMQKKYIIISVISVLQMSMNSSSTTMPKPNGHTTMA